MDFQVEKKQALHRKDKSRKGKLDEDIRPIIDLINSNKNYYTTSSCSGRILLIKIPHEAKKHECEWLFVSHKYITVNDIKEHIRLTKHPIWLKVEPAIIHVCCNSLKDAKLLLKLVKEAGLKKSNIISISKRIIVEIVDTEYLNMLIARDNKLIVNDFNILVDEINFKLKRIKAKLKKLYSKLKALNN